MQRMISILTVLLCFFLLSAAPASAWLFSDDTLVTIDDQAYTTEDFKRWWIYWNTDKEPLPATPDTYVDWLLLRREGVRMELDQDPGFKRQTRIYLQSRGLLMLKNEAVNSRINVTDAQIRERYERDYTPRWRVERLIFMNEENARAAWAEVDSETLSIAELLEREAEQGGPAEVRENWVRPNSIDPGWVELLTNTALGAIVDPDGHTNRNTLYYLKEKKGGDPEDLVENRERIQRALYREQEGALTQALLQELREKYQVLVDHERLAQIDLAAADNTFGDEPLITTNRENVTEEQYIAVIRRLQDTRPDAAHAAFDEEKATRLKQETVENIIAQSLTNWESLDRKFEEREPFKWEYQFNYNHRLTLTVAQRLFAADAQVSDEQIEQYYRDNLERYTQPAMAKLFIIDETQGPIDRFWAEVATGSDFKRLLRDHFAHTVAAQEIPVNHLEPEIRAVADRLVKGETSQIFNVQGGRVMVHLEDRTPERLLPLDRVRKSISTHLWERNLEQVRNVYLDRLKGHSRIEVKSRQWRALQKELGGA